MATKDTLVVHTGTLFLIDNVKNCKWSTQKKQN